MAAKKDEKNYVPLYSAEAEKAVLGAVLLSPDNLTLVEGLLQPEQFFLDAHQKIFSAITSLSAEGSVADFVTVANKLREYGGEDQYLDYPYLLDLTENCPQAQNIEYYAKIIRDYFYARNLVKTCEGVIASTRSFEGQALPALIENIEKELLSITKDYDRKGIVQADKVLESTIEDIQKKLESDGTITGVPTGFTELDQLTGGMQPSDLIILAARPGMGKTAIALNIATNAALAGKSVVVFTLEMSKEQLMSRVLSSVARVDSSRLRKGDLSEEEQDRLMEGARRIFERKESLGIDETPGITLMELRSRCRRYHKEFGLDMVVIDYLQLMTGSARGKTESRERELAEISMGLKGLAKELRIPIIALAQLNRQADTRPDKRPKISDLRESGSMEQDADMILFVYRDEYYNPGSELTGIAEVMVAKNRHGSTTTVKLAYQPNFVTFQNLYQSHQLESTR